MTNFCVTFAPKAAPLGGSYSNFVTRDVYEYASCHQGLAAKGCRL